MADLLRPTPGGAARPGRAESFLLSLEDERSTDVGQTGVKAAALAVATREGLPTLPGLVVTTSACAAIDRGLAVDERRILEPAGALAPRTVARSSSVAEDLAESSGAGQFVSVLDVAGPDELRSAIRTVLDSRARAEVGDRRMAVLIQPFIEPATSGVLFGADPVTGRSDRLVVTAVRGSPQPLVSGEVEGSWHLLDRRGRVLERDLRDGAPLSRRTLRALVALADRAAEVFGAPQDIEWAELDGELVLLQSRPITTEIRGVPGGPVYGPGPVAETFPERLRPLEAELWIPPLRDGVLEALRLTGAVPTAELDGPDLVIAVDGWAAIDLERTGEIGRQERRPPWFALTARLRRLRSAWRVGRLRSALPTLADRLVDRVDDDLERIPALEDMTDRQLVALLGRSHGALRSLHAHEVLMGLLVDTDARSLTSAAVAMRVLAEARTDGRSDAEIVASSPIVLALTAPRIGPETHLPPRPSTPDLPPDIAAPIRSSTAPVSAAVIREALRLRARWVHELTGRAAWTLGERLVRAHRLPRVEVVPYLGLEELTLLVTRRTDLALDLLDDRVRRHGNPPPLPARFRLTEMGRPVAERVGRESGGGTGAGGGIGRGPVTHDADDPPAGSVLVVRTLAPGIGPLLPRLSGVVAETGSVLAHLAILARERGVATVVGHAGALDDFAEGVVITVDGTSGRVVIADPEDEAVAPS